jgi:ABC-2 type transport system permease protein
MSARPVPASNHVSPGDALADVRIVATRNVRHVVRTPQLIVASVVQTVLFLLLFRYVFGGSIVIPGLSFVDFLIPGYIASIAIFDGFGVSIGLAEDAKSGLIERFRALPMARSAFVGGRALADLLRQGALVLIVIGVGYLTGFRIAGSAGAVVLAFALALLWGFALFWVFAFIGRWVRDSETAQAAATPFFILFFVSSAVIQVDTLPGWLQPFARNQPMSQVANALRGLMDGPAAENLVPHSTGHYVMTSVVWCAAIIAVFAPLAIRAYRRP